MITQLSLSPNTIKNLHRVKGNPSSSIEWLARTYMSGGFPAPYIVVDRAGKQVINVNISPYTIGILKEFTYFGLNSSQAVEWLVREYILAQKQIEQPLEQPSFKSEPKPKKEPRAKSRKVKQQKTVVPNQDKPAFVHTHEKGLVVKKAKIKPVKR